jgi:hypothetical protein
MFLSLLSAALIGLGFVSSSGHLIKPYLSAVPGNHQAAHLRPATLWLSG